MLDAAVWQRTPSNEILSRSRQGKEERCPEPGRGRSGLVCVCGVARGRAVPWRAEIREYVYFYVYIW